MQSITEAEQRLRARAAALAKLKRQKLQAKLHPKPCSALTKQGKPCARRALAPFREKIPFSFAVDFVRRTPATGSLLPYAIYPYARTAFDPWLRSST